MDRLNKNLAVSNAQRAREIGGEFDRVVSLASPNEHTTHEHLIDDGEHDYEEFRNAVNDVIQGLENNEDVLVHCMAGISRSVSVCIAALTVHENMEYNTAYNTCRRGFQHPDPSLIDSAKKYIEEKQDN